MEIKATLNKPYTESDRIDFIVEQNHIKGYEIKETSSALEAWGLDDTEELQKAKENKVQENDTIRDLALIRGVTYQNILFDSDTDQKVNLLATVSMMEDTDTIEWFGMNNDSLLCTKEDLVNIGTLITALHTFCWTKNAQIKAAINNALTVEALEEIVIDYSYIGV